MRAFVDVGAYKGSALSWIRKNPRYAGPFTLFAWECNPSLESVGYGENVTAIRAAAWTCDGTIKFYRNAKTPNIQGNSVYRTKITGNLDKDHPLSVPCLDFSGWLKAMFLKGDFVVVKMNIEGAEYDVLEKCVSDGTINLISELHVQWHASKIPNINGRHVALQNKLKAIMGLKIYNGYGQLRATK